MLSFMPITLKISYSVPLLIPLLSCKPVRMVMIDLMQHFLGIMAWLGSSLCYNTSKIKSL